MSKQILKFIQNQMQKYITIMAYGKRVRMLAYPLQDLVCNNDNNKNEY